MKILYVPSLNMGVSYWRIESYATEMLKLHPDVKVTVKYFFDPRLGVAWDKLCVGFGDQSYEIQETLEQAFWFFDVIIFQKVQFKEACALIDTLKKKYPKVKVIAEIDDCIGDVTPSNPNYLQFKEHHRWAAEHCAISDGVIVSTEYLGNTIKDYNQNVHVVPNTVQPKLWKFNPNRKRVNKIVRVGYVAAGGHDEDLKLAYEAVVPLLGKSLKLIIRYGDLRPDWLLDSPHIDFKSVSWSLDEYPQKIEDLNIDIALAPLRDTEFNRCKSNLKWIEWASHGVPLVASNVEPYKKTKGSIFLCENSPEQFTKQIKFLRDHRNFTNSAYRRRLKEELDKNYNISTETAKLLKWLEDLKKEGNDNGGQHSNTVTDTIRGSGSELRAQYFVL